MKKLLYLFLVLGLMMTGCIGYRRHETMRAGLDSINERNRNDLPFTVSDVQPYVDYFDDNGLPNDRLLAHYLLGRAYYEQGESPMALQCYQDALDFVDTTETDCDLAQLSRVYGQMGWLFYEQSLYRQYLIYENYARTCAWKAKDTLTSLIYYEQQKIAYDELGMLDSAIFVIENVSRLYDKYGYHSDAAIALGSIARNLLIKGNIEKAHEYMQKYEIESGLFGQNGKIQEGREAYYNTKGFFHFKMNRLDSAEYWYRKELTDGKDFNNQNGGAFGLAMVFEQRHIPDSAAKYYQYAYAMNDSMYAQMATETISRTQALYNYSRHQQIAAKEAEKASRERNKWLLTLLLLIAGASVASLIIYRMLRERKENKKRYINTLEKMEHTQSEVLRLRGVASKYSELHSELNTIVGEKEREIEHLKEQLYHNQRSILQNHAMAEEKIKQSKIRQSLLRKSRNGVPLSNDEIRTCRMIVIENLPELNNLLLSKQNYLNNREFDLCVLFRLGFQSKEMSNILNLSPARISQMSTTVLNKLFGIKEGGAKELTARLSEYF